MQTNALIKEVKKCKRILNIREKLMILNDIYKRNEEKIFKNIESFYIKEFFEEKYSKKIDFKKKVLKK